MWDRNSKNVQWNAQLSPLLKSAILKLSADQVIAQMPTKQNIIFCKCKRESFQLFKQQKDNMSMHLSVNIITERNFESFKRKYNGLSRDPHHLTKLTGILNNADYITLVYINSFLCYICWKKNTHFLQDLDSANWDSSDSVLSAASVPEDDDILHIPYKLNIIDSGICSMHCSIN